MDGGGLNKLGMNAFDFAGVDVFDKCAGKAVLHAEQNAYFLHTAPPGRNFDQCTAATRSTD
jgi:hypothetical protein